MRKPLQHLKRVHIGSNVDFLSESKKDALAAEISVSGSFVLVFSFDKENKEICFENYKHHDEIYKTN